MSRLIRRRQAARMGAALAFYSLQHPPGANALLNSHRQRRQDQQKQEARG